MLLVDEYDEDFVSLGTMQDTLKVSCSDVLPW